MLGHNHKSDRIMWLALSEQRVPRSPLIHHIVPFKTYHSGVDKPHVETHAYVQTFRITET